MHTLALLGAYVGCVLLTACSDDSGSRSGPTDTDSDPSGTSPRAILSSLFEQFEDSTIGAEDIQAFPIPDTLLTTNDSALSAIGEMALMMNDVAAYFPWDDSTAAAALGKQVAAAGEWTKTCVPAGPVTTCTYERTVDQLDYLVTSVVQPELSTRTVTIDGTKGEYTYEDFTCQEEYSRLDSTFYRYVYNRPPIEGITTQQGPLWEWVFTVENGDAKLVTPWGESSLAVYVYTMTLYTYDQVIESDRQRRILVAKLHPNGDKEFTTSIWSYNIKAVYKWIVMWFKADGTRSRTVYDERGNVIEHEDWDA